MKALYFDGELEMRDIPEPVPGPGEALVRVKLAGICRTDIEIARGYMQFRGVPGHEFVGVVERAGREEWIGRRVVGEINVPCGDCEMCDIDQGRHCYNREVLGIQGRNGAFAEKLVLPLRNLFTLPDTLPDERAVYAEPVAACTEILEQIELDRGAGVLVTGDGKLGILAAQVLRDAGCKVRIAGKYKEKMEMIKREFDIDAVAAGELGGGLYDIIVECSGRPGGLQLATERVKPRGVIVLKSTYNELPQVNTSAWVVNEVSVIGSRCGRFGPSLRLLYENRVNPLPLTGGVFPFEQALEAFDEARRPGALKILLEL